MVNIIQHYDKMKIDNFNSMEEDYKVHYKKSVESGRLNKLLVREGQDDEVCVKASEVEDLGGCPDLFTRFSIFASGDVALCSADQAEYFKLGNVINEDPIKIFNNDKFSHYREKWLSKSYKELEHCKSCTIVMSRFHKTYVS